MRVTEQTVDTTADAALQYPHCYCGVQLHLLDTSARDGARVGTNQPGDREHDSYVYRGTFGFFMTGEGRCRDAKSGQPVAASIAPLLEALADPLHPLTRAVVAAVKKDGPRHYA
jgi:hypothetical protein